MAINKYFQGLKKTGPPVETGRPLRLLDMRLFNCICCAENTACNGKKEVNYLPKRMLFFFLNHLRDKHTATIQTKRNNLWPDLLRQSSLFSS
jgi:hypothetical protein